MGSDPYEDIADFQEYGVRALMTTRAAGDFALGGEGPVREVLQRWWTLRCALGDGASGARLATAVQVHGASIIEYGAGWGGWLRADAADGHFARQRGTACGITTADCVPAFIAHPSGAVALLHAGWRGTAAGIVSRAIALFAQHGLPAADLRMHLGPAICGRCYEVGPSVYAELTGRTVKLPTPVDLRALLADQATRAGVRNVELSQWCTRCHNDRFFSHRAGDAGRQVAAIVAL